MGKKTTHKLRWSKFLQHPHGIRIKHRSWHGSWQIALSFNNFSYSSKKFVELNNLKHDAYVDWDFSILCTMHLFPDYFFLRNCKYLPSFINWAIFCSLPRRIGTIKRRRADRAGTSNRLAGNKKITLLTTKIPAEITSLPQCSPGQLACQLRHESYWSINDSLLSPYRNI